MISDALMRKTRYGTYINYDDVERYYAVPFLDLKSNDEWYVAIKLNSTYYDVAEKAMDVYKNYIITNKKPTEVLLSINGIVRDMTYEEKEHIPYEYMNLMDWIYVERIFNTKKRALIIMSVTFLVIALSVSYIVYYIRNKNKEKTKLKNEMKLNNPENYQAPQNIYVQ